jgi:hypothetical protein
VPEPTASTALTKLRSLSTIALGLAVLFAVGDQAAFAQNNGDIAKARNEVQKLEKPLYADFEKAESDYKKNLKRAFGRIILQGTPPRGLGETQLEAGIKHHLYMLTNPKLGLPELQKMRSTFMKVIDKSGATIQGARQTQKHQDLVFGLVTKYCEELLDGNYYVRMQAIKILSAMGAKPSVGKQVPYVGSKAILLKVARNSEFQELRLHAMAGLARLIKAEVLKKPGEMEIAVVLANELKKPGLPNGAYHLLAEWLHSVKNTFEVRGNQSPVAIVALLESMNDGSRSWIARARAARALGCTGDPKATIKWSLLAWKVAQFAHDAAVEFKKQGGRKVADPIDPAAMVDIFLAFTPPNRSALEAGEGLLNRSDGPIVRGAYDRIRPVVAGALEGGINDKDIKALADWLKANQPADRSYHSQAPPLPEQKGVMMEDGGKAEMEDAGNTQSDQGKSGSLPGNN